MKTPGSEELTDLELNEMLATWIVSDPHPRLKARIFSQAEIVPLDARDFAFPILTNAAKPWYRSLIHNIRDLIRLQKLLPPLEVTSKPVEVGSIWGAYSAGRSRSSAVSVLIHAAVL